MNRPFTTLVTAAVVTVLAACADDSGTPQAGGTDDATGSECPPELDEAFSGWAEAGFSGSIAIATGGDSDCLAAYGLANQEAGTPNTVDTVFSIGSISKAFTAAAVVDLADAGELSLDDRAADVVPDLGGPVADATIGQLLLHTSGLTGSHGNDHEPLDRDEAVAALSELEQAFEPGSDFLYSNGGYTLLALVVEEVTGTSYRDYVASEILSLPDGGVAGGFWDGEPAAPEPRAVGYLDDGPTDQMGDFEGPHWALNGNGDLAMTTGDLATWTHALFTGQIVSPAAVEVISTPGFDQGDGRSETPGWVAHDESTIGEPFLATAGGGGDVGHNAVVAWLPESERVISMASNTPDVTAEELLQAVGPALVAGEPLPTPEAPAGDVDPADLEAHAGTYELDTGGSFDVTASEGQLAISATGADALEALFPLPEDITADGVTAHEDSVLALLEGETQEGREELDALESDFGAVQDVELVATIVDGGELRTYVTVVTEDESVLLWYVLDERGGIAAAEVSTGPPTLLLVPADDGSYRPHDPTGAGSAEVTVEFEDDRMTISGPTGSTDARLAP